MYALVPSYEPSCWPLNTMKSTLHVIEYIEQHDRVLLKIENLVQYTLNEKNQVRAVQTGNLRYCCAPLMTFPPGLFTAFYIPIETMEKYSLFKFEDIQEELLPALISPDRIVRKEAERLLGYLNNQQLNNL